MRFFIALEIPSENLASFQAIQAKLHTIIPQARLTNLSKIHLTLAFVGEQNDDLKDNLITVVKTATKDIPPFIVYPGYIDGFPNLRYPQIFWVGVKGEVDKILLIREKIKDCLENLKLPTDERRFIPHITIAKLNSRFRINSAMKNRLEKIMDQNSDSIHISSVKLFQSIPYDGFHKHHTLSEIKLI